MYYKLITDYKMPNVSDDAWIDLCYLLSSSGKGSNDNTTILTVDFPTTNDQHNAVYMMRNAIRAVGHKIKKINYYFSRRSEGAYSIDFVTDISNEERECMWKVWEAYIDEYEEEIYTDSDSESEDESEQENNTEENDDLNTDPI